VVSLAVADAILFLHEIKLEQKKGMTDAIFVEPSKIIKRTIK
jgi:hypothetical protein